MARRWGRMASRGVERITASVTASRSTDGTTDSFRAPPAAATFRLLLTGFDEAAVHKRCRIAVLRRQVCRLAGHDWWALAYPPCRRSECTRCGLIVEEAPIYRLSPPTDVSGSGRPERHSLEPTSPELQQVPGRASADARSGWVRRGACSHRHRGSHRGPRSPGSECRRRHRPDRPLPHDEPKRSASNESPSGNGLVREEGATALLHRAGITRIEGFQVESERSTTA